MNIQIDQIKLLYIEVALKSCGMLRCSSLVVI